jgi:hypothetical protein
VDGDEVLAVVDADLGRGDERLDAVAGKPVRSAVPDGIDVDERVVGNAPLQAAAVRRQRPRREWPQRLPLPACVRGVVATNRAGSSS